MISINELRPGAQLERVVLDPVSRMDLIKYSRASGDFNPIHTIDEEAKKAGLPGIIAHGMWTMGNLAKLFTAYYEEGFIQDYTIRFSNMVFLNDVLTLEAETKEITDDYVAFDVRAVKQDGKTVIKGAVTFKKYV